MKIVVAAVQMQAELSRLSANVERADVLLDEARGAGAALAVLPEMFNTGHGFLPDYGPLAEGIEGTTLSHLRRRSREWRMGIAAGFVERDGSHLYDALALCLPDGSVHVYRKLHPVFWERYRFRPGRSPLVVATPWGRVGLAICADMIHHRVWEDYRGRIDLAIIAAAWPEFACRHAGRAHRLFGLLGPLAARLPDAVARDLGIPVIFANQCGPSETTIPLLGLALSATIADRFAGMSRVCDGKESAPVVAEAGQSLVISEVTLPDPRGPRPCPTSTSRSARVTSSSGPAWS